MDTIDLSQSQIHNSPADIASWPATVAITEVAMDPRGGLTLAFNHPLAETWKWPSNPANPSENFQYTVWAVVKLADGWHAAGFVQMWQGRAMGDGSLPPILSGFRNWWGDLRRLWGAMSDYVPQAGDQVGFFVSAGNARLRGDVTSVRERSTVVVVTLPTGDLGSFSFDDVPVRPPTPIPAPAPSNTPAPVPVPPSIDLAQLVAAVMTLRNQVDVLTQQVAALAAKPSPSAPTITFPNYNGSFFGATIVLRPSK
jgi:hypothetical protein